MIGLGRRHRALTASSAELPALSVLWEWAAGLPPWPSRELVTSALGSASENGGHTERPVLGVCREGWRGWRGWRGQRVPSVAAAVLVTRPRPGPKCLASLTLITLVRLRPF